MERQTDNDKEPDSDLQRLWAWDTEDFGALEVFFHLSFFKVIWRDKGDNLKSLNRAALGIFWKFIYLAIYGNGC